MIVRVLRSTLAGLLMLSLALPAWALHVCACSQRLEASRKSAAPLRPCCAKKLALKTPKASPVGIRAKCCCDEMRWNQTVAKVTSPRQPQPVTELAAVEMDAAPLSSTASSDGTGSATWCVVRAGPLAEAQILLCRWQV